MIVQCADCKTSFRLRADLVPPRQIQVRCAQCGSVFAIDGRNASTPPAAPAPAPQRPAAAPDPAQFNDIPLDKTAAPAAQSAPPAPQPAPPAAAPAAPKSAPVAPAMEFEIERSAAPAAGQGQAATATALETPAEAGNDTFRELDLDAPAAAQQAAPQAPVDPELEKQNKKARRLARALVSDILVYNREKRDSSLQSGNLVQVLGPEIKKSWEVYKERVAPELADNSDHFREALNEILAEGQPIF